MCYVKTIRFSPCPHRLCLYFFKHVSAWLPLVLCDCVSVLWHCLSPACLSPRCSSNQWLSRSQQCQWHSHLQRWAPPHSLLNASHRYDASQYKLSFSYIYLRRSFLLALSFTIVSPVSSLFMQSHLSVANSLQNFTACISATTPDCWIKITFP